MQAQPPPNPFAPLGLPPTWQAGPVAWAFGHLDAMTDAGVEKIRVVLFDTPTGRIGLAFPGDTLRTFSEQALEQCTGLYLARGTTPAPFNGRPA